MSEQRTRQEWYADYIDYRAAYGYKTGSYNFIISFLNWCSKNYPDDPYLRQEMLDRWRAKRPTENEESNANRASSLNKFLRFIHDRSEERYTLHEGRRYPSRREPSLIDHDHALNFFRAVDELPVSVWRCGTIQKSQVYLRALELPVLFRLMYSSGIRPNEARLLDRKDIDLEKGIIYLRHTKGYNERIIALHPSMTDLLKQYDKLIREAMPDVIPLFPNAKGSYPSPFWICINFKQLWYKYNPKPENGEKDVVSYAFRHNYAIQNIMNWHQDGYNADKRLVALSRSMGHVSIQATQYYFHLVPRFADMLEDIEGDFVNNIIPEVEP